MAGARGRLSHSHFARLNLSELTHITRYAILRSAPKGSAAEEWLGRKEMYASDVSYRFRRDVGTDATRVRRTQAG